ncbi:MAG: hypothetical protein N2Z58_00795 [Fervidobacterium sp.]|nr:hypothetical protein [Fervidobacterium sp.]
MKRFKITFLLIVLLTGVLFSQFYLNVGTVKVNDVNYMVYEFGPEFTIGPVLLGVTLQTYTSDLSTGQFYFGAPGSQPPSTNIIDGINIVSFGLDLGAFWFRYGSMKQITYGMGFVFNGYFVPNTHVLDAGLRLGNLNTSVHVPYRLKQLSNFSFEQSDSLYTANVSTKLLFFDLSLFGGMEVDEDAAFQYIAGASLTVPFLGFSLGTEADIQMWRNGKIGYGAFGGLFGDFGVLQIVAGPYYASDGFLPWALGKNYPNIRKSAEFKPENYNEEMGYIVKIGFTLEPYGKILAGLKGDFQGNWLLNGEGVIKIPAVAGTNGLVLYGYLYDNTPFQNGQILDTNSDARLTIAYPLLNNFFAGVKYIWNGSNWIQTPFVGGFANF